MKILYHHRIASKDGQYVHLEELTNALKKLGHEIFLVGPKIVETQGFGSEGGIVPLLKKYIPKSLYELMEFSYSFYDFFKLIWFVYKYKPDCIYERYNLFFVSGIWVKKITKLAFLCEVNSPLYNERFKFGGIRLHRLAKWTEKFVWRNADYTLPVTKVLANIIAEETGKKNQIVIHNGINPENFQLSGTSQQLKKQLGINNQMVLGFTGFVREWHKIEQVLDMIKTYPEKNMLLLLVGDGPARKELEEYAKKIGVEKSLVITGIIGRKNVGKYIELFDIALQPAVTNYASPLKMFEYLALGKLIIAPDEKNIKEILTDNYNALLFNKNDPESFKKTIVKAINIENKNYLTQNAQQTIRKKNFTWLDNAQKVINLFNTINQNKLRD